MKKIIRYMKLSIAIVLYMMLQLTLLTSDLLDWAVKKLAIERKKDVRIY